MHFIDRSYILPPKTKLKEFVDAHKTAWATYNQARAANTKPLPPRPPSSWLHNDIRGPLKAMFLKTCGYCGIHTDAGNDAEVDHHYPTSKDLNADRVFDWENYIWSCPSCNGMKDANYPVLNPCSDAEMKFIYFNESSGRYLYYNTAPDSIKDKFVFTEKHTNINGKNRPARRKCFYRDLTNTYLSSMSFAFTLFQVEAQKHGVNSAEARLKESLYLEKKNEFLDLIRSGDYLFLLKVTFEQYVKLHGAFSFTFDDLLKESNYLN